MRMLALLAVPVVLTSLAVARETAAADTGDAPIPAAGSNRGSQLPKFGIAVSASTLGVGIQAATAVSRTENLRFGFNYFPYTTGNIHKDSITYNGTLKLRSAEVLMDQYVGRFFHFSPGMVIYDGNEANMTANAFGNQLFTLGGASYYSDPSNPVNGTGHVTARKVAPEILVGFGNLLPRSSRHVTVNVEFGVVFQGSPNATLNLHGNACAGPGSGCVSIASTPAVQANVAAEQDKINNDMAPFKYYPVFRLSLGYKF